MTSTPFLRSSQNLSMYKVQRLTRQEKLSCKLQGDTTGAILPLLDAWYRYITNCAHRTHRPWAASASSTPCPVCHIPTPTSGHQNQLKPGTVRRGASSRPAGSPCSPCSGRRVALPQKPAWRSPHLHIFVRFTVIPIANPFVCKANARVQKHCCLSFFCGSLGIAAGGEMYFRKQRHALLG